MIRENEYQQTTFSLQENDILTLEVSSDIHAGGTSVCVSDTREAAEACCNARDDVGEIRYRSNGFDKSWYCNTNTPDSGSWDSD